VSFDPVPWAVGGGAEMSTDVLRTLAHAATHEGVIDAGDLKILPLEVPGGSVRWSPGSAVIDNRSPGGGGQKYVARNPVGSTEIVTPINPTGSGGGRSDLIVVRVEDPQYPPWDPYTDPEQIKFGPYVFPRVIENVGAGVTHASQLPAPYNTQSMLAVARVDLPASTATVEAGHIVDLRGVAQARESRTVRVFHATTVYERDPAYSTERFWLPHLNELIFCPAWATRMRVVLSVNGLHMRGTQMWADLRAEYGFNNDGGVVLATEVTGLHYEGGPLDPIRQTVVAAGDFPVPPAFRNKAHYLQATAKFNPSASADAVLREDEWLTAVVDVQFEEVAD
jgi:hypothetical protein